MEKRKDAKGRNLKEGESQNDDGRYRFRYTDSGGKRHVIYSWRLVSTDKTPTGKKDGLSLRELEAEIMQNNIDGIDSATAAKITVNAMFKRYMQTKDGLKDRTRNQYNYMYDMYISKSLGKRKISAIKYSDMRNFYSILLKDGLSISTVKIINSFLRPTFTLAIRDGLIRSNPTDGALTGLTQKEKADKRHALTIQEQTAFMEYARDSEKYNRYFPLFVFMLGTGCRIGETIGLTWGDVDFKENTISINHTLAYTRQENGKSENHITTPKTAGSIRTIPMFADVKGALLCERARQKERGFNPVILDGYGGFVFTNTQGNVYSRQEIGKAIRAICKEYNAKATEYASNTNTTPVLIRDFVPHDLRHTFCTRLCENEANIKVIQEIMGHANINITMGVYAEATENKKQEVFKELEGKIKIV